MSELPKGWHETNFAGVIENVTNGLSGKQNKEGDGIAVSRIETIAQQTIDFTRIGFIADYDVTKIDRYKLEKGDILFSHINSPIHLGKTAVFNDERELYHGVNLLRVSLNDALLSQIFDYYCKYIRTSGYFAINAQHAVNQSSINQKKLKAFKIPVPPLNEQIRIANKLDSLLTKVEIAQARLEKIPVLLKHFRQAVLAAATSGGLTEEWRLESPVTAFKNDIKGKFQLSEEIVNTFELPNSWQWAPLGNLATCARGKFSVRPRNDPSCFGGDYPFIQIGNLPKEGGFVETHQQTLNEKGFAVSKLFNEGTVVLAIVGATIANSGILRYPMCFPDSLVGINAATNIENIYIDYFLRSVKEDIRRSSYAGGGQPNIKLTTVNPLPIPVPPKEEIVEIVRRVESLFAQADKVEQQYKSAKSRLDRLTQSILAKAFRGKLVPQDPNDEPASELLKRIKTEREQLESKNKSIKKVNSLDKKISKLQVTAMTLDQAPNDYLFKLLEKNGGEAHAEILWKQSQLPIDDFYVKLKEEMGKYNIIDHNESADPSLRKLKVRDS